MKYLKLAPANVEKHWGKIGPWVGYSLFETDIAQELIEIKNKAIAGQMQIWIAGERDVVQLVFLTEGFRIDGVDTLVIRMATGSRVDEMLPDFALLEQWAVKAGYTQIQVWGRLGWIRKLRPLGFRFGHVCLTKELDRGIH